MTENSINKAASETSTKWMPFDTRPAIGEYEIKGIYSEDETGFFSFQRTHWRYKPPTDHKEDA